MLRRPVETAVSNQPFGDPFFEITNLNVRSCRKQTLSLAEFRFCDGLLADLPNLYVFFFFLGFGAGSSAAVTISKFVNHSPSSI